MTADSPDAGTARRIHAAALVLLPQRIRERYGDDMRATFADRCRDASAAGRRAVALLLVREIADLTIAALGARRRSAVFAYAAVVHRRSPMTALAHDLRYTFRMLRRQPGFTTVAIATLALGIGATTAVFTVVNGVLLRPLPYRDPDRLVQLFHGRNGRLSMTYSPPNYRDVTTDSGAFAGAAAIAPSSSNVTGLGDPLLLDGANVTPSFFTVLGVTPRYGRGLVEADGADGGAAVVVIGDGAWRRLFGARPDVVGATIRMDGKPFTIVGVAPADLQVPGGAEYWRPLVFAPADLSERRRGAQYIGAIARLKDGVDLEQAKRAMAIVAERLSRDAPRTNKDRVMTAVPLQERIVRNVRPALLILLGSVALVLLVACVNVANLLLARANGRTREVAVRVAIGAGRGRLVRQFLSESAVLGAIGGAGGLAVAYWSTRALVAMGPGSIPRLGDVSIDWRVLAFTMAVAIGTSVVFGLVPALAATHGSVARCISSAGRGAIGHGTRLRKTLVVCEMALAVILLIGAGLLMRSYERIANVDPGFAADHVLTFTIGLPDQQYKTADATRQFVVDLIGRLRARPGVATAAGVYGLPLDDNFAASSSFTRRGEVDSADTPSAGMRIVTPEYFAALKIPLRSGRLFTEGDTDRSPEVVLINEEAARRFFPGKDPVGEQIHLGVRLVSGVRSGDKTIVGVVGDVKFGGLDISSPPEVYLPYAQHPVDSLTVVVRTAGNPQAFIPIARGDVAAIDRDLPLAAVRTMDQVVGRSIAERRFTMVLLASFAGVAVLLAAVGVYGVLAYVVAQRTQEIGVRLAMGAAPRDVVRLFLREGALLSAAGVVAGLAGAVAAARALTSLVFGITTTDPATFAGVAAALAVVALAASYVPARRAARVDPAVALRTD